MNAREEDAALRNVGSSEQRLIEQSEKRDIKREELDPALTSLVIALGSSLAFGCCFGFDTGICG